MTYSKKALLQGLREQISQNSEKSRKALLLVYSRQTEDEKSVAQTIEHNCVGFTAIDAEILTSIADFYLKHKFLTPRQDSVVKSLMPKYAEQILQSSIERGLIIKISPRKYEIAKNN